jgi:hypothetical protein
MHNDAQLYHANITQLSLLCGASLVPSFLRSEAAIRWRESAPVEQPYEIISRSTRATDGFAEPLEARWRTAGPAEDSSSGRVRLVSVSAALTCAAREKY